MDILALTGRAALMTPQKRAAEMLRIAAKIIREHAPEGTAQYDETICDGLCIADDCEAAADEVER